MSIKSVMALLAVAGLVVGAGCIATASTVKTPTPVPTASTPVATATPAPVTLLSLTNNGAAVPAFWGVFDGNVGGGVQAFTVATAGKVVTTKFTATAPVTLTYGVTDPNGNVSVPTAITGAVQAASFTFTPVIAGVYRLTVTAAVAIPAGVTVTATVTQ